MTKQQLQAILSSPYDQAVWKQVLIDVFGVKRILQTPQPIYFTNTSKASGAYELGSFSTKDDRIIGIYQVNVNPEVWLERNKVGLRTLLRDVYKYDVDGALIVFVQENKWRLSFVSEIKTLNERGEIQTQATEPKRYTYLLGEDEKVLTPAQNLAKIAGKPLSLEDIRNAFSVEALNEEFYKIIAQQFYELVGATAGKGKNSRTYERKLQLPSTSDAKTYQEFAVRLIGRTIFCWFLKVKKSTDGLSLLPEHLLGSIAVIQTSNYYHTVLERLFFQTLNTPMEKRPSDLPEGANQIPFLNGGLFDYQEDDFYIPNKITGLSENINTLVIPDLWFLSFFQELEKYNFTIDENSTVDIEVSIDPEMLGHIFESLLAEIDPDSGETARKATGSFYTPREIVDYMATESLVHYLHNKTGIEKEMLSMLFKIDMQVSQDSVLITQKVAILEALDILKILDPACGSGAFPMGVLQKIVMALQKVDPNSVWWKNKQIEKNDNPVVKNAVREKLNAASVEYARKIGIIQNSLYGVDIQPIAAEISKLRCFLTLIVDENIDESKPNRGVEPLPNLEFKFVTADSLRKLPQETNYGGLFNANDDLDQLKRIRQDYLQSFGEEKATLKTKFKEIQDQVAQQQFSLGKNIDTNSRAYLIGTWKPFSHEKVDWFDPEWMFGINGFDIVIGNPPYVEHKKLKDISKYLKPNYEVYTGSSDLSVYFFERAFNLLSENGTVIYINTNKFFNTGYGKELRRFLLKQSINFFINFEQVEVFKGVLVSSVIFSGSKKKPIDSHEFVFSELNKVKVWKPIFEDFIQKNKVSYSQNTFDESEWSFSSENESLIRKKIEEKGKKIKNISTIQIKRGVTTGFDPAFIIDEKSDLPIHDLRVVKTLIKGKEIKRYNTIKGKSFLLFIPWHFPLDFDSSISGASLNAENELKNLYPTLYSHLLKHKVGLEQRNKEETGIRYEWFCLQRCAASYFQEFENQKIVWPLTADKWGFALDENKHFLSSGGFFLVSKEIPLKYILAILNSKLFEYYFKFIGVMTAGGAYTLKKATIEELNIIENIPSYQPLINLVDYILFLNALPKEQSVNEYVPNNHIVQVFEEVIDGMVYELYFKEDFEAVNIEFIKYAERDFRSIEGIDDESEKIKIIHEAYQKLREKDNEIRNNLKLMLIELKDLIMPIKTAK